MSDLAPGSRGSTAALANLLFGLLLLVGAYSYAARATLGLDDSYIFFRVAENWLAGHGPVFNPGDLHSPITSPLWLMTLVGAKSVLPAIPMPTIAFSLCLVLSVLSVVLLRGLLAPHFPLAALLSPLLLMVRNPILTTVGIETSLALALALGLLLAFRHARVIPAALLASLLYLARPDGILLVALLALVLLLRSARSGRDARPSLLLPTALFCAPIVAWHVYSLAQFQEVLAGTLEVKLAQGRSGHWPLFHEDLLRRMQRTLESNPVLYGVAALGVLPLARHIPLLVIWALVHVAAYSVLRVPHYHWYYYPLAFTCLTAVLVGASTALSFAWKRGTPGRITALVLGLLLLAATFEHARPETLIERRGEILDRIVRVEAHARANARYDVYRRVADWIDEASAEIEGPSLLAHEVGILGYYAPGLVVRDSVGLASPGVEADEMLDFAPAVRTHEPTYIVKFVYQAPAAVLDADLEFALQRGGSVTYDGVVSFARKGRFAARIYQRVGPAGGVPSPGIL